MAEIDLEALEALAKAATPGPWVYDRWGSLRSANVLEEFPETDEPTLPEYGKLIIVSDTGFPAVEPPCREYVAAVSPEVVLALIAELRTHRDACDDAKWDCY